MPFVNRIISILTPWHQECEHSDREHPELAPPFYPRLACVENIENIPCADDKVPGSTRVISRGVLARSNVDIVLDVVHRPSQNYLTQPNGSEMSISSGRTQNVLIARARHSSSYSL